MTLGKHSYVEPDVLISLLDLHKYIDLSRLLTVRRNPTNHTDYTGEQQGSNNQSHLDISHSHSLSNIQRVKAADSGVMPPSPSATRRGRVPDNFNLLQSPKLGGFRSKWLVTSNGPLSPSVQRARLMNDSNIPHSPNMSVQRTRYQDNARSASLSPLTQRARFLEYGPASPKWGETTDALLPPGGDAVTARKTLINFAEWAECFALFAAYRAHCHPDIAVSLLMYLRDIAMKAQRFRPEAWMAYDRAFRFDIALNPAIYKWDQPNPKHMIENFQNKLYLKLPLCYACNRRGHLMPDCPRRNRIAIQLKTRSNSPLHMPRTPAKQSPTQATSSNTSGTGSIESLSGVSHNDVNGRNEPP